MANSNLQAESGSANGRVLKFTGAWEGRFEPSGFQAKAQCNALNDARKIVAAKESNGDWTASLLLGILSVLDDDQLTRLEICLAAAPTSGATEQALALVRLRNSSKEYRERVQSAIEVLKGEAD
jgi:hypothetical protein